MMKVLVIDNDPNSEHLVSATFKIRNTEAQVVTAADGDEGLSILKIEKPDLVILNKGLNGINGFVVCREIRRFSNVPVIMLTSRNSSSDVIRAFEVGADDYIEKPFSYDYLSALIRSVMRRTQWQFV